jgi:hypothetical protein
MHIVYLHQWLGTVLDSGRPGRGDMLPSVHIEIGQWQASGGEHGVTSASIPIGMARIGAEERPTV